MKNDFFLKCDCDEEGLSFVKYHGDNSLWISLFKRSHIKYSIKDKLKLCYRILFNKELNLWDIIISEEKLKQLKKFINSLTI